MTNIFDVYGKDFEFYITPYALNGTENPYPFGIEVWDKISHRDVGRVNKKNFQKVKTTLILIDHNNNKKIIEKYGVDCSELYGSIFYALKIIGGDIYKDYRVIRGWTWFYCHEALIKFCFWRYLRHPPGYTKHALYSRFSTIIWRNEPCNTRLLSTIKRQMNL